MSKYYDENLDLDRDGYLDDYEKEIGGWKSYEDEDEEHYHISPTGGYYSSGKGLSNGGAIFSVVAGLVLSVVLYMLLGIEVENVPVLIIVILWAVFSTIVAVIMDALGV